MTDLATIAVNGLSWAMTTFLVASGLTLVFGVLHILNFSHGGFFMVEAYLVFTWSGLLAGDISLPSYLLLCAAAVAALGLAADWAIFRRLRNVDGAYAFIGTYALLLVVEGVVKLVWGINSVSLAPPAELAEAILLGDVIVPEYSAFIMLCGAVVFLALDTAMRRTPFGKLMQAVAADPMMCSLLAVNVTRIYSLTIVIGFGLAGLAGGLLSANQSLDPAVGGLFIIQAFGVIVVGGMGSVRGALVASLLLGMMEAFGTPPCPTSRASSSTWHSQRY